MIRLLRSYCRYQTANWESYFVALLARRVRLWLLLRLAPLRRCDTKHTDIGQVSMLPPIRHAHDLLHDSNLVIEY